MDKLILKKLIEDEFGDKFVFLPGFYEDFEKLTKNSGNAKKVSTLLLSRLNSILELDDCNCGPNWMEHLIKYGNMYSLHLKTNNENYRALFSIGDGGKIFLHMFYERSGKRNTSYSSHVPIAIQRKENYLKGL